MYKKLSFAIATLLGTGYFPFAPGTAGSLMSIPLAFVFAYFFGFWGIIGAVIATFIIGTIATHEVLKHTKHDPSFVVIDETAGQLLTFAGISERLFADSHPRVVVLYLIGFALFRLFDITKPQPAKWADSKVLNAWGVMLDDIFAGIYAALVLYAIEYFLKL
ncbi:MAG: phosphatidylglycerophosphatase A [Alphaproteobacteria bacterium]|nr:phosphatidylglycerophosphatase A [Alphaproteobacteria bacterium]